MIPRALYASGLRPTFSGLMAPSRSTPSADAHAEITASLTAQDFRDAQQLLDSQLGLGGKPYTRLDWVLGRNIAFKLENETRSGAYKDRGCLVAMNKAQTNHFTVASTGNHALAACYSLAVLAKNKPYETFTLNIVIPRNIDTAKHTKLLTLSQQLEREYGSRLRIKLEQEGENFDEARRAAQAETLRSNRCFIEPYRGWVLAGQATIAMELLSQLSDRLPRYEAYMKTRVNTVNVFVPVGGGGLITGMVMAFQQFKKEYPALANVAIHVVGLKLSPEALNTTQLGKAIQVKQPAQENRDVLTQESIPLHPIDDHTMQAGLNEMRRHRPFKRVEGQSAAALALQDALSKLGTFNVCVVSGGNS
jgi:threonine dehydratase